MGFKNSNVLVPVEDQRFSGSLRRPVWLAAENKEPLMDLLLWETHFLLPDHDARRTSAL